MPHAVRPAREGDLDRILELIRALAEYERLADQVVSEREAMRRHLFGTRPAAEVLVAEEDGAVVGFALFFPTFSTFLGRPGLWLEDLFVLPAHRGRGHGGRLLRAVARLARERGCGRLEWSVLDWNAPAIAVYRRVGAVPMDDWTTMRLTGEALERYATTG